MDRGKEDKERDGESVTKEYYYRYIATIIQSLYSRLLNMVDTEGWTKQDGNERME
jgi:hypothetical protein